MSIDELRKIFRDHKIDYFVKSQEGKVAVVHVWIGEQDG
jgi:hypothetical protein